MTSADLQNKILNFKNNFLNKEDLWVYQQNNFDLFLDKVVIEIIKITKLILNSKTTMIIKEKILKEEMFLKESMIGKKYIFHGLINKQMNKRRGAWIAVCHFVTMVVPWVI